LIKFKPVLSIKKIGTLRFILGVLLGIGYSIFINFWFRIIDYGFFIIFDFIHEFEISYKAFYISSYNSWLLALVSTTIGFSFTIYFWSNSFIFNKTKKNYKSRFTSTNSFFIAFLVLFYLNRLLVFNTGLRHNELGIDFQTDYQYLTLLLPVFIFFCNWNTISRVFKSGKFIIYSGLSIIIFSVLLSRFQTPSILLTGFTNTQLKDQIDKEEDEVKLITKKILGKWTNEKFLVVPPPPPPPPYNDTLEDPYYQITKDQIIINFYTKDSVSYKFEGRNKSILFNEPIPDFYGYQIKWKILKVDDSTLTVKRIFNVNYLINLRRYEEIDTLKLNKK